MNENAASDVEQPVEFHCSWRVPWGIPPKAIPALPSLKRAVNFSADNFHARGLKSDGMLLTNDIALQ